jgi:hypothetical protein
MNSSSRVQRVAVDAQSNASRQWFHWSPQRRRRRSSSIPSDLRARLTKSFRRYHPRFIALERTVVRNFVTPAPLVTSALIGVSDTLDVWAMTRIKFFCPVDRLTLSIRYGAGSFGITPNHCVFAVLATLNVNFLFR